MVAKYLLIENEKIKNIILAEQTWLDENNFSYILFDDEAHHTVDIGDNVVDDVITPGQREQPVIPAVEAARLKVYLFKIGLLSQVELAVNNVGGEIKIWWDNAKSFDYYNEKVQMMGAALNLSEEKLKEIFINANLIE